MNAPAGSAVFQRVVVEPAYKAVSAAIERAILDGALPPGAALLAHVSRNALFLTMRNVGLPATSRQLHESSCARCGPGATAEPNCLQVCLACKHLGGGR